MVTINYAFREISCKIVYYGPGLSGKTTNLQYVHNRVPSKSRGDLISLATEADRTLYFDFLPINVGDIAGFATKFQLYTVPGQVFYNATRKLVLRGVDGIVFVADSQAAKMDENIESLSNMYDNLKENTIDIDDIPIIFQYNKRDLPDCVPIEELERVLNPRGYPYTEASAVTGQGVFDTLKRITKLVLEQTKKRTATAAEPAASPAAPPAESCPATGVPATGVPATGVPATTGPQPVMAGAPRGQTAATAAGGWTPRGDRAPVSAPPAPVSSPQPREPYQSSPRRPRPVPPSTRVHSRAVHAPQRSLRVRTRQRSLWSRLTGWLFGR